MKNIVYDYDSFGMDYIFVQCEREPESHMSLYVLNNDKDGAQKIVDNATEEYWAEHDILSKDAHYCTYLQFIKRKLENNRIPYMALVNDLNPLKDKYNLAEWNGDICY